jgi:hypothetical protein
VKLKGRSAVPMLVGCRRGMGKRLAGVVGETGEGARGVEGEEG